MALAAADFVVKDRERIGPGCTMIVAEWTGPASYASGGEILTHAIAKAAFGLRNIHSIAFQPLIDADGSAGSIGAFVAFDYTPTSTTHGKIRVLTSGAASHTHDMLAIGGLVSSEPLFLDASQSFGKNAATNRTIVGSTSATTGGVVANTVDEIAGDVAAATNLSGFKARVVIFGH